MKFSWSQNAEPTSQISLWSLVEIVKYSTKMFQLAYLPLINNIHGETTGDEVEVVPNQHRSKEGGDVKIDVSNGGWQELSGYVDVALSTQGTVRIQHEPVTNW